MRAALALVVLAGCSWDWERFDSVEAAPPGPCEDGVLGPGETDVDCGGDCGACPGEPCGDPAECVTGSCQGGVCALASSPPSWLPVASMPTARFALAATLGPDGRIYAIGGLTVNILSKVEAFTPPPVDAWETTIANMPLVRRDLAAATAADGSILALGGKDATVYHATVDVLAPDLTWQPGVALPEAIAGLAAVRGPDDAVYILGGGTNSAGSTTNVYKLRQNETIWEPVASMVAARHLAAATLGPDNRIFVFGGALHDGMGGRQGIADVEAYDAPSDSWETRAPLPTPRYGLSVALGADARIYAVGGAVVSPGMLSGVGSSVVEAYTEENDVWHAAAALPIEPAFGAAVSGRDGCVYAVGGINGIIDGGVDNVSEVHAYCPRAVLAPSSAAVGQTVTVTGSNFAADARVHVYFATTSAPVLSMTSDATGALPSASFVVPPGDPGTYTVKVMDMKSRYPVTSDFTVTP